MKKETRLTISVLVLLLLAALVSAQALSGRFSDSSAVAVAKEPSTSSVTDADAVPVLVELFTSEGCSSCPPADQVLSLLDKERSVSGANIIVLSQHVDYWNQLGWRDPYSSAQFSERQGSYAGVFGRNGVYTPQMVVDGRFEFVGSNLTKARAAIKEAAALPKASIEFDIARSTQAGAIQPKVRIENLPAISKGDTGEVFLAVAENDLSSSVARGENAGRNLRHAAVVRRLTNIGTISDTRNPASFTTTPVELDRNWRRDRLRLIVFVQERVSRHIIGAAMIELAP